MNKKEWEKEFEEIWKTEEFNYGDKFAFYPIIKRLARWWWFESRQRFMEKMKGEKDETRLL